jgi:hypothetical protein
MALKLDSTAKSQVSPAPDQRKSIYDVSGKEVFFKSLLAGFALGLGQILATIVFFGLIAGVLLTAIQPWLNSLNIPLEELSIILQRETQLDNKANLNSPTGTTTVGE